MTKKTKALNSLVSVGILYDRITDEESYRDIMPFIRFTLDGKIRRILNGLPFANDLMELVDCAIAYSDDVNAFGFALDDLMTAVECL